MASEFKKLSKTNYILNGNLEAVLLKLSIMQITVIIISCPFSDIINIHYEDILPDSINCYYRYTALALYIYGTT